MKQLSSMQTMSILIFFVAMGTFTIGLLPEFQALDARFALFAQEMLRNGPTFFPTTYGKPYPDYTAASTFLIYLSSLPWGRVTPLSAILPTAITSALILVVIFHIGAMHSKQWGLWAVLLGLFTKMFFAQAREISLDQYVSLVTVMCFYLVHSSNVYNKRLRLGWIPGLLLVGFAFRGPIGLIVPGAVVCGCYALDRNLKWLLSMGGITATLLIVGSAGLVVAARHQGGNAFVDRVITMQVTSRLPAFRHGPSYYWIDGLAKYAVSYPLALIVLWTKRLDIWKRATKEDRLLAYMAVWIVIILGGLSIPGGKKMHYILPALPAFALAGSYVFVAPGRLGSLQKIRNGFLGFCHVFPYGASLFCALAWLFWDRLPIGFEAHTCSAVLAMLSLTVTMHFLLVRLKDPVTKEMIKLGAATVTFFILSICITDQSMYDHYLGKPFVQKVAAVLKQTPGELAFYQFHPDAEGVKFLVNYERPLTPKFISSPQEIVASQELGYVLAREEDVGHLSHEMIQSIQILERGRLDAEDFVLFTATPNTPLHHIPGMGNPTKLPEE